MPKFFVNVTFESEHDIIETGFAINGLREAATGLEHPLKMSHINVHEEYELDTPMDAPLEAKAKVEENESQR